MEVCTNKGGEGGRKTYVWEAGVGEGPSDGPAPRLALDEFSDCVVVDLGSHRQSNPRTKTNAEKRTEWDRRSATTSVREDSFPSIEVYHLFIRSVKNTKSSASASASATALTRE